MAVFQLGTPDGKQYEITADNPQAASDALNTMLAQQRIQSENVQNQQTDQAVRAATGGIPIVGPIAVGGLSNIDNAMRSIATGVPLVGGAMDEISAGLNTGFGYLGDYGKELAYQRERDKQYAEQHPIASAVGNLAGGVAGTIAGLRALPAAAVPATLPGKMALGAGANAVLGGAEGYTRGEGGNQNRIAAALTAAPIAGAIGAVAPGAGALIGKAVTGSLAKKIADTVPASAYQGIKNTANQMWDTLRNAGIFYHPDAFNGMVNAATKYAKHEGYNATEAPGAIGALDKLNSLKGSAPDFNEIDGIRKSLFRVTANNTSSNTDKNLAHHLLDLLDEFSKKAPLTETAQFSAPEASILGRQARELSRRTIIAAHVKEMARQAPTYQSGEAAGIRNQFSNYLRSGRGKMLTPQEQEAFMRAAKGTPIANLLIAGGKFGFDPTNMTRVLPLLTSGSALYSGIPLAKVAAGMTAATGAAYAGRKMMQRLGMRAANVALAGTARQKEMAAAHALSRKRAADIAAALLATQGARVTGGVAGR